LHIRSALLFDTNKLRVSYSHNLKLTVSSIRLTIQIPREARPRVSMILRNMPDSVTTMLLPEKSLEGVHGTLLAALVAEVDGKKIESYPVWVIQENQLTYERGERSYSSQSIIEETGEGLSEYLDEIGRQDGLSAVIDYLRHLNIRFQDGGGSQVKRFRMKIHDPFQTDVAPGWLIEAKGQEGDLEEAIYEFVKRHEKQRLRKHARHGNINGMENFLDIITTLARLLYVYYKRKVVKKERLIGSFCTFIELATSGSEREKDPFDGYMYSVIDNLSGDIGPLQEACNETNYFEKIQAILLIVQCIRFNRNEEASNGLKPTCAREVLQKWANALREAIVQCGLPELAADDVRNVLEHYNMFGPDEISQMILG
jgi:hypothetical protein